MKRRTEEERREILQGLISGKYMILDTEDKVRFGAGLILSGAKIKKEDIPEIACILGDLTSTIGDRVCNGVPLFSQILLVHKEDWKLIANAYNSEMKRLKTIEV